MVLPETISTIPLEVAEDARRRETARLEQALFEIRDL
jgi:hypothetical protein